jgi:hypothetical protein
MILPGPLRFPFGCSLFERPTCRWSHLITMSISGKSHTVIPDEVEQSVSEYAGLCINMRAMKYFGM